MSSYWATHGMLKCSIYYIFEIYKYSFVFKTQSIEAETDPEYTRILR